MNQDDTAVVQDFGAERRLPEWIGWNEVPFEKFTTRLRSHLTLEDLDLVGRGALAFFVPMVAIQSFHNEFLNQGFGLLAGMGISLTYAFVVIRRTLSRSQERKELGGEDAHEVVEECGDFFMDLIACIVLAFLVTWTLPTGGYLLGLGVRLQAWAVIAGSAVLGIGSVLSLVEGLRRLVAKIGSQRSLDEGEVVFSIPESAPR